MLYPCSILLLLHIFSPLHTCLLRRNKARFSLQEGICCFSSALPLDTDPVDADDNVHALLVGAVPLVRKGSVLVRVPEGTHGAVHASTAGGGGFRGVAQVLDYGAVGDEFVGRMGGSGRLGKGGRGLGFLDEVLEDGVL